MSRAERPASGIAMSKLLVSTSIAEEVDIELFAISCPSN